MDTSHHPAGFRRSDPGQVDQTACLSISAGSSKPPGYFRFDHLYQIANNTTINNNLLELIPTKVFMIKPANFGFNPETAKNNAFQQPPKQKNRHFQIQVLTEFDHLVKRLRGESIEVDVLEDNPLEERLDAIFSNNWFSTHPNHSLITYPMFSPIRRRERDPSHIQYVVEHYHVLSHISLEYYERDHLFLEGTGSLIIDHEYGLVYGNRSPRTHEIPFNRFCQLMGYTPVLFDALDDQGIPVYHTNVVMGIGQGYAIINRSAIPAGDWDKLSFYIRSTEKEIIEINHDQMGNFLGNTAFIHNSSGQPFIIMSERAFLSMNSHQKKCLKRYGTILHSDLSTIESIGGGSAKCMITENYLGDP